MSLSEGCDGLVETVWRQLRSRLASDVKRTKPRHTREERDIIEGDKSSRTVLYSGRNVVYLLSGALACTNYITHGHM